MFTQNGDGLKFSVCADYTYANDWMSFALWYSMRKNLPDAELSIFCKKHKSGQLFSWCRKLKVNFNSGDPGIVLPCDSIMIRELPEGYVVKDAVSICSICKNDEWTPFVSYGEGFTNFVTSDWLNTTECPFPWADRFMTTLANANEVRVLKLWKQLDSMYATVSRS